MSDREKRRKNRIDLHLKWTGLLPAHRSKQDNKPSFLNSDKFNNHSNIYEFFKKDGKYNWFLTSVPVFVVCFVGGKADRTSGPDQAKVCQVKPTKHRTFTGYKAFSN